MQVSAEMGWLFLLCSLNLHKNSSLSLVLWEEGLLGIETTEMYWERPKLNTSVENKAAPTIVNSFVLMLKTIFALPLKPCHLPPHPPVTTRKVEQITFWPTALR